MIDPVIPPDKKLKKSPLPVWIFFVAGVALLGFLTLMASGLLKTQQKSLTLGSKVPDFSVTMFDGNSVSMSSLQGKTVLINFWASWCTSCMEEASSLEAAWQQVKPDGKVVFIGIDYADTEPAATAYLEKYGIDYWNGPDLRSAASQLFRVGGVPETYLISGDGTLLGIKIGPFESMDEISTFLAQKADS